MLRLSSFDSDKQNSMISESFFNMISENLVDDNDKRNWLFTLFSCYQYKNRKGEAPHFPYFCPIAMCCTGYIAGVVVTKSFGETPCLRELGPRGCLACCLSIPFHLGPCGGVVYFSCLTHRARQRIIKRWNVKEEEACPCGSWNVWLDPIHFACNFPCALFQMHQSVLEWELLEQEKTNRASVETVLI